MTHSLQIAGTSTRFVQNAAVDKYLTWNQIKPAWEAGSFLPQQYGKLFNLRLTIRHNGNSVNDHTAGSKVVSDLTHQMTMRVDEWNPNSEPQVHWLYRHEADAQGRLVTRVVMSIPEKQLAQSIDWAQTKFLVRHSAAARGASHAIAFRDDQNSQGLRFHWGSIRSLSRSLDPALLGPSEAGVRTPLVDLLAIPNRWRQPIGSVRCAQGRGSSESLGPTAQRAAAADRMAFLSAIDDCAWSSICSGWEVLEHADRQRELSERQDDTARISALFIGSDEVTCARRIEEIALDQSRHPNDPKQRCRGWTGWWQLHDKRKPGGKR